jgi:tetratricopeptide (TPR) repeat protein
VKTIRAIFLIILLLFPVSAIGEIHTITHTVKQTFGGSQSPDDARISAIAKAKREALEVAGTYIESLPVVQNSKVEKDEILVLAAGVLKVEVLSQKNYASDDAFGIEIIVNVVVDTSVLEERVKKLLQDRTHLTQLKDTQKREKELLKKVAQLEEENRRLSANKQSTQKLKKEFQKASQGLTAVDWLYKATALWDGDIFTNPKKAIEYLNNAIKLQPNYAYAYGDRGTVYAELGRDRRAIEDFNEAIHLKPDLAYAYNNRGATYAKLGQDQRAIEDFNEAIYVQPDYVNAYYNRGAAYAKLGQHQRAIEDYNEAIHLKPDLAAAHYNRGNAYVKLGQHQRAIEDYNEAIQLKPDLAIAYYNRGNAYAQLSQHQRAIEDYNDAIRLKPDDAKTYYTRGAAYGILGQYQRAIEDCNEAIHLKPDYADAYGSRGGAYLLLGNNKLGCRDVQKACVLGSCKWLKSSAVWEYCR